MNIPQVPLSRVAIPVMRAVPVVPGEKYRTLGVKWWGGGAYERETIDGSQTAAKALGAVCENDLIINKIWVRHGSTGIVPKSMEGCVGSSEFPTFELDREQVEPRWLHWQTKTEGFWQKCDALSQGTSGKNRIKPDLFLTVEIPLPPLSEQRRIVARVEELAAKIEEARKLRREVRVEADTLSESGVDAIFRQTRDYKTQRLETLASKIGSGSTPSGGRTAYPASGIPFIRSLNVRMRHFKWDDIAYISSDTHQAMQGTTVSPNDVLLNITGASIGRVACSPDTVPEANVNQHVAIIRPTEKLLPPYLMYWLSQRSVQNIINNDQKGATRQGFTKAQIQSFNLPVPPLEEQERIVIELDALQAKADALKALQAESATELDALLPSVLDKAFRGEL